MKIENPADLNVLIQTARTGTLTGAARALNITPAAASATLKRLEAQLAIRLFERSTRAMRITPQGQVLLDYALRAFELLTEGESQLHADQATLVGNIRVAAPSDLARTLLLPWFDAFLRDHPGVRLTLAVADQPLDLVRDEVDVAIRYGELDDSRLVARLLATPQLMLSAAPSYLARRAAPRTPQELQEHNCITFGRGGRQYSTWRFCRDGQWTSVRVDGDRTVDDASVARAWALGGAGIILKSRLDQAADLASGAMVPLLTDWQTESYPLHALLPSGRFIPHRVRALVDMLAERFGKLE